MGKYRKKPVVIEAVQFSGVAPDWLAEPMFDKSFVAPDWLAEAMGRHESEVGAVWFEPGWKPPVLQIHTLEGTHRAMPGDWIIRGVKGELYPCKPDIFAKTYELVEG